ncbi:hypothetical protein GTW66_03535 [Streptomyces sp. SID5473]|uniref:Uncharacterized protein n=1 Tax=Streptomyces tsukubensis (strain DSM 42081 / NBRC 108919 / NRRL 18488 / 9993) TaxID=1114943 RepID=A0A7G3UEL0_STRT9|nr:hypothetical protein B7R87_15235 [Streptomyces tsukubensis]MYS63218.1 hypothetical protein [Streptomyces sp. SID5473]QKM68874.1 hypothetical protein STSU_018540 [Streptomyces tsukubensis NRRL18488]TAI43679.1 hypothetical protein EWI31_18295 [Streptomyces tsukubensis]
MRRALEDASMGRWEGPHDLLISTGPDWDPRIFRLQVLAEAEARLGFADQEIDRSRRAGEDSWFVSDARLLRELMRRHGRNAASTAACAGPSSTAIARHGNHARRRPRCKQRGLRR